MSSNNIFTMTAKVTDKILLNLIVARTGGLTTSKIIDEILIKPQNANQLARTLNLNYTTITYHTDILCKNNYVNKEKFNNYYYYSPSDKLIKNLDEYILIKEYHKQKK